MVSSTAGRTWQLACRGLGGRSCTPRKEGRKSSSGPAPLHLWSRQRQQQRRQLHAPAAAPTAAAAAAACALPAAAEGWPLYCLLLTCAAVGQVADSRTRLGGMLGGPLISMLAAVGLAAAGVIPTETPAYDVVWTYLMPLAASCFLLDADAAVLFQSGGPLLISFLIGAVGMVLGALSGWFLLKQQLGPQAGGIAAALCASYVGGSINFVAVAQVCLRHFTPPLLLPPTLPRPQNPKPLKPPPPPHTPTMLGWPTDVF
jgi:hypothetical protein